MKDAYHFEDTDLRSAADRMMQEMHRACRGKLPVTLESVFGLVNRYPNLEYKAINRRGFVPEAREVETGEWVIFYNPYYDDYWLMRSLIHEWAEYIAVTQEHIFEGLFDGVTGSRTHGYFGGDDPNDIRHKAADYVEFRYAALIAHLRED